MLRAVLSPLRSCESAGRWTAQWRGSISVPTRLNNFLFHKIFAQGLVPKIRDGETPSKSVSPALRFARIVKLLAKKADCFVRDERRLHCNAR